MDPVQYPVCMPCRISAPVWGFIDIATAAFVLATLGSPDEREREHDKATSRETSKYSRGNPGGPGAIHGA